MKHILKGVICKCMKMANPFSTPDYVKVDTATYKVILKELTTVSKRQIRRSSFFQFSNMFSE